MEKLSKKVVRKIMILKIIGYVFFGVGFVLGTVKENMNIFLGFGVVTLALLAYSSILYWKDYKRRKNSSRL